MRSVNPRHFRLLVGSALFVTLCGAAFWMALRLARDRGSVSVQFAGTTNFNERTFVLFAITNRLATNIRGSAFQINYTDGQWIEAIRPLNHVTTPGRRDIWLAPAGGLDSGTVLGIIPTSSNTWRIVFGIKQGGVRKTPWRNRLTIYLHQHGYHRLAQRVSPRAKKGWPPQNYHDEAVLGPDMRGTQLK